jgi:transcriptional regulator with XRE-family HTH domain
MRERTQGSLAVQIGQRVRKIRQMRSLTQKALAAHLVGRVDYSYIGKIERGEQLPSLKVLQRVAEALNVPLDYFFSDEAWTDLLPEEIRRIRPYGAQATLLRETIRLHPDDIPLVREILGTLVRHRHQVRAGGGAPIQPKKGRDLTPQALPRVAEGRPAYVRTRRQAVPRAALQGIRKVIQSLRREEGEHLAEVRRRLEGILRELATPGRARGNAPTSADA